MMPARFMDLVPLWGIFLGTIVFVMCSIELAYQFGKRYQKQATYEFEILFGTLMGATLGLLAFFLAFTFSMAASRFEERRLLVLEEANAIRRCYLRAGNLPEANTLAVRHILREYILAQLEGTHIDKFNQAMKQTNELQNLLWAQAVIIGKKDNSSVAALFIESVNQLIEAHTKRLLITVQTRISRTIWEALYFVTFLTMSLIGYHSGVLAMRNLVANCSLALIFATVIYLISDLDRPFEGFLNVTQQPMIDFKNKIIEEQI